MRVSVIGGSAADEETLSRAERVGELLAERGHTVVCGGLTGVMTAVCTGAQRAGGQTIGILRGTDVGAANEFVDIPIATGIGDARNVLVVMNGSAVIAIDGRYGTLSELAFALKTGRPVAGLDTHEIDGVEAVSSAEAAVRYVERVGAAFESG